MKRIMFCFVGVLSFVFCASQNNVSQRTAMSPQEQFNYLVLNSYNDLDSVLCSGWAPLGCGGWQIRDLLPAFGMPACVWGPHTESEVQENWNRVRDPECLVMGLADHTGVPRWFPPNFAERYLIIANVASSRLYDEQPEMYETWKGITFRMRWPGYEISLESNGRAILLSLLSEEDFYYLLGRIAYVYPTKERRSEINAHVSKFVSLWR